MTIPNLQLRRTPNARADLGPSGNMTLKIPPGPRNAYRLAQSDDYTGLSRSRFPHQAPVGLELRARVSDKAVPGTWGFGFWNAPFSFALGFGERRILPALPNAAWFFFASPENYLSFRDDLPARGFLAQTFRASPWPTLFLAPAALALPALLIRPFARFARRLARRLIKEDSRLVPIDPTEWHTYSLQTEPEKVSFSVDGNTFFETPIVPHNPLGLVIWIDNQFAAFTPEGRLGMGVLGTEKEGVLEVGGVKML